MPKTLAKRRLRRSSFMSFSTPLVVGLVVKQVHQVAMYSENRLISLVGGAGFEPATPGL
jgi:hypothetical protein